MNFILNRHSEVRESQPRGTEPRQYCNSSAVRMPLLGSFSVSWFLEDRSIKEQLLARHSDGLPRRKSQHETRLYGLGSSSSTLAGTHGPPICKE